MPTTSKAAITKPLAPPGNFLIFASGPWLENFQMKKARMNCAARNEIPASAIVSDICSSISRPCVEMSSGAAQVCSRTGIADKIAMIMMVTAKNFAMLLCLLCVLLPYLHEKRSGGEHVSAAVIPLVGLRLEGEADILGLVAGDG